MKKLLLISNSTLHGGGYLDHCASAITKILGKNKKVLFVPYALDNLKGYADKVRERFEKLGFGLDSIHEAKSPAKAAENAEAIFIGGGNTFRLLTRLYENKLIEAIRQRVSNGMPYIGSSAGSNMACPTIKTTNDMPIVYPPSFEALRLVPFQINPHYLDSDPNSTHMGETRETRIREFHEMNTAPVIGLREGCWLRIEDQAVELAGVTKARLFQRGLEAKEFSPGDRLDFLLNIT